MIVRLKPFFMKYIIDASICIIYENVVIHLLLNVEVIILYVPPAAHGGLILIIIKP